MIDVVIAERKPQLQRTLQLLLELDPDIRIVGAVGSIGEALRRLPDWRPAVLLADHDLIREAGESLASLHRRLGGVNVLALALYPGPEPAPAPPGVCLLPKDAPPDQLAAAVRDLGLAAPHSAAS